jgi:metal-responsive CopG/Arc/MetJ family transcriptional regulator
MKTAVSIPDPLFKAAERAAKYQKVSRSRYYARALASYLRSERDEEIKKALDAVYGPERSELDPDLAAAAYRVLGKVKW